MILQFILFVQTVLYRLIPLYRIMGLSNHTHINEAPAGNKVFGVDTKSNVPRLKDCKEIFIRASRQIPGTNKS